MEFVLNPSDTLYAENNIKRQMCSKVEELNVYIPLPSKFSKSLPTQKLKLAFLR